MNEGTIPPHWFVIKPLEYKHLGDAIGIHKAVLGYTLNSQLGDEHLAFMYSQMSKDAESFVAIACISDQPIGLISGTKDLNRLKNYLLRSLNLKLFGDLIFHLVKKPSLLIEFYKNSLIDRPIYVNGKFICAILTTIVVDPCYQSMGVGEKLVSALEKFFTSQKIQDYRLDTLVSNRPARAFYRKLGFKEVQVRADSVLLIKRVENA